MSEASQRGAGTTLGLTTGCLAAISITFKVRFRRSRSRRRIPTTPLSASRFESFVELNASLGYVTIK